MKSFKILLFVIVLLLPAGIYAFEVKIQPQEVAPGDAFYLNVPGTGNAQAYVRFQGRDIDLYLAEDNRLIALVPVDINTKPGDHTLTIKNGKEKQTAAVTVLPHKFKTIKLTLPEGKVILSPENLKRARREASLMKEIWPRYTGKSWAGKFTAPTRTEVSTLFGVRRVMNEKRTSVHRGMDFRGKAGTPVRAVNSGKVILNDDLFFGGNTLVIDHGMGLFSVYMHLSKIKVAPGETVSKGQVVGAVGMSGRATGPHLHLSVKLHGVSINPESLFKLEL